MRAIVLLSGGLDSYTAGAMARREGFELSALTIALRPAPSPGTRGRAPGGGGAGRRASPRAAARSPPHRRLVAHVGSRGPERPRSRRATTSRRPMFRRGTRSSCRWRSPGPRCSDVHDIVIGVNALDYSGYPDCRPAFIAAFEAAGGAGHESWRRGAAIPRAGRR